MMLSCRILRSSAGLLVAACTILVPGLAHAQTATIQAPARVTVGQPIELAWTGPSAEREFISIDEAGARESAYGPYVYANAGQPAELRAPDVPGTYAIRYHRGSSGYPVIATHALEVADTTATFHAIGPVAAGAQVSIEWLGPGWERDFISIDPAGAGDRQYGQYAYARSSPVVIRAPDQAGEYVVRYHLATTYRSIGQTTLTVGGVAATLTAPAEARAGSDIEVAWQGPGERLDFISIDADGAADRDYGVYAYASAGNPVRLRLPDVPGRYLIRYHMGQSWAVIGSTPIDVTANAATVRGPASVTGGTELRVEWTGPDNVGDYITIVQTGADSRDYLDYAYTREGSTVVLRAPLAAGPHELRYMTGQSRQVLASAPIEVTPGVVPGTVRVVAPASVGVPGPGSGAVEVILDASGSMLQRLGGERRIDIAKEALRTLVRDVVPSATPFALRAFGHREANSCRTDLEIPLAPLEPAAATARIGELQAMNLAKTPIAASLARVREDLPGVTGPVVVVLITDGEETCEGDPAAAIQGLRGAGFDVRVNIVGFAIDEHRLREEFETWARAGNGRYVEANDASQLADAMGESLRVPFEIVRDGVVVATGVVNGESLLLEPGTYIVRLPGATLREFPLTVESGGTHTVEAGTG